MNQQVSGLIEQNSQELPVNIHEALLRELPTVANIPMGEKGGIVNLDRVQVRNGIVAINVTLCPLYRADSSMVDTDSHDVREIINTSRVGVKWDAQTAVAAKLNEIFGNYGIIPHWNFTFADLGIIPSSPQVDASAISAALGLHFELYRRAITLSGHYEGFTLSRYTESGIDFPLVLQSDKSMTVEALANRILEQGLMYTDNVFNNLGTPSKRFKKRFKNMVQQFGEAIAPGLILQYLTFDRKSREGNLNLYFERTPILLTPMNTFDPDSVQCRESRIEVLCYQEN